MISMFDEPNKLNVSMLGIYVVLIKAIGDWSQYLLKKKKKKKFIKQHLPHSKMYFQLSMHQIYLHFSIQD
jgi:hypothetical protein